MIMGHFPFHSYWSCLDFSSWRPFTLGSIHVREPLVVAALLPIAVSCAGSRFLCRSWPRGKLLFPMIIACKPNFYCLYILGSKYKNTLQYRLSNPQLIHYLLSIKGIYLLSLGSKPSVRVIIAVLQVPFDFPTSTSTP